MQHRFKQYLSLLLAAATAASLCLNAFAAGLDSFAPCNTYRGQFTDIGGWYEPYVIRGYELGLIDGTGADTFSPDSNMTIAEAVKLAACLHSTYTTGSADFPAIQGQPWWQVYADYCLEEGILAEPFADYGNAITRAQFAALFAAALPETALTEMNDIPDGTIPDVRLSDSWGSAVYLLYRAGILTGSDSAGTFRPKTNIRRSEAAAILVRMVDVTERRSLSLSGNGSQSALTAAQIYAKCAPSVFSLTTYDAEGEPLFSGSGVFLRENGEAVTNWHVLEGAASAKATAYDGTEYEVSGVYDYDAENDLARIQVRGSGFTPAAVNASGVLQTGATVYAIGNPRGLDGSLSSGLISSAHRVLNGAEFIQVTVPISNGSSGGALLNDRGELIGVTSASVSDGQNLNLAVPIEKLSALDRTDCRSVSATVQAFMRELADGFTLSKTSVTLGPGDDAVVTCSVPNVPTGYSVSYETSTRSIVQCSWGKWTAEDTVDLTITGQNLGDVTVTISLHDRTDAVLATRTIQVRVR